MNFNNPDALNKTSCTWSNVYQRTLISLRFRSAAAADIIIACALCYYLTKNRTGFSRLTTGLVTSVIAFIAVVTFATMPTNFIWLAFFWILGKCYVNSILAALNSRDFLRGKVAPHDCTLMQLSPFHAITSNTDGPTTQADYSDIRSMSINLRDTLLAALARLPGTREFHLHVLVSSPRKNASLFPFATPRPRAYLQDILILLSEQTTPDSPRIFVTAIEASVYNITSTSSAILYISKVDSTGQATPPSPTYCLVRALLAYYADPATRPLAADHLWIHLFARAQSQYLFPNSAEYAGKLPLSDVKLCAWWKRVLSDVAGELEARAQPTTKTKLHYILPGYSEFEAVHSLRNAASSSAVANATGKKNLGHFIPSFEDDPKSRFMDEMAYTTDGDVKSPIRKRSRTSSQSEGSHSKVHKGAEEKEGKDGREDRPLGELRKVTPDEFWERMSFRQECVAGASHLFHAISPLAPQPGQVSSKLEKRIMTSLTTNVEFSTVERAIRGTEIIEGAIRGLCEGIAPVPTTLTHAPRTFTKPREFDRRTPERETSLQPSLLAPPSTPPPHVSPNPFPEPVTSLETYHSHIYGSICVSNPSKPMATRPDAVAAAPQVTVLTARKKKKRTD
ncbi:histone acetylation protein-domain-containing protein [Lyophyllum atratum]|nr:histone acetylation protein-domain-containing protein [Lyophyllum atratum]